MPETPAATVWQEVCGHINAAAFGPVIGALESGAVLERLLDAPEGREVDALAYETGTRSGLLHLAARLFELEGLGCRSGNLADCRTNWRLTQAGKKRVEGGVREALDRGECSSRLAQAMARIYRGRATSELAKDNLATLVWSEELAVLGQAGWAERRDGLWRLNERGNTALPMAAQFLYTDGYLPLLARAPELILGQTPYDLGRDGEGEETHVDRETDIAFSGLVFRHTCKDAFLELALPLFSSPARPSAVVDTGAGDGELLLVLAEALRQNGLPPVTMIAVEFNEVARSVAAHRLAEAGARHLAIRGDIGAPDAIAEALSTHGIDMADACHVSKSVIHNRSVTGEAEAVRDPVFEASLAVHLDQQARPLTAARMAGDLVEHFRRWLPWTRRHGMITIEAHSVDPKLVARAAATPILSMEITHGLSLQHLVEPAFHRRAAALAGFRSLAMRDLQTGHVGAPLMTCDHLLPI